MDIKKKLIRFFKSSSSLLLNPRLLLCFGFAWLITNGWAYVFMVLGSWLDIGWMVRIASGYLAFIWVPFTPEKILTTALAILILRWLFPNDQKTLAILKKSYHAALAKWSDWRNQHKNSVKERLHKSHFRRHKSDEVKEKEPFQHGDCSPDAGDHALDHIPNQ